MAGEPTVIGGSRNTLDVLQAGRYPDKSRDVTDLEPNTIPLLRFTKKLAKKSSVQPEFSWFEDEVFPYWSEIVVAADAVEEDLEVRPGHGPYFPANTVFYIPATSEYIRVRSTSGDVLTCQRGFAGTTAAIIPINSDIRMIGDAFPEGSDAAPERSTVKTEVSNFCQIFKTGFGASGTQEESEMWWGDDRSRERRTRAVDHNIKIESAFLFGPSASESIDPDTGKPIRTTQGCIARITSLVDAINGPLDEDAMEEFIEQLFRYSSKAGENTKWLFASRMVMTVINRFGRERIQTVPEEDTFGVKITEYITSLGALMLIPHNLLENSPLAGASLDGGWEGTAIGMDPDSPRYRPMRNRDTKLERDIELPGSDTWKDQFKTECGLEFRQEGWNGLMTGITRA